MQIINHNVSRETQALFSTYVDLLQKWNSKVNLIAKSTIDNIWQRHISDSIQLRQFIDLTHDKIVDLGSGAGFPGIVLALIGAQDVTLVESDSRKAAFLLQAARIAPYQVSIVNSRIEDISLECDILTARAVASISDILTLCNNIKIRSKILLLKGKKVHLELAQAKKNWHFEYSLYPSITNNDSQVVELTNIMHKT